MSWTQQWERMDPQACSVARTAALVGDRWSLLVLREAFNGIARYTAFRERLGIPPSVLSERLGRLVEAGVLSRDRYREPGQRAREEYRLTERGADLRPVLLALLSYGDQHLAGQDGPPVLLTHRDCGAPVELTLSCANGHRVGGRELRSAPGPGARYRRPGRSAAASPDVDAAPGAAPSGDQPG